jgi:hypothetical protein
VVEQRLRHGGAGLENGTDQDPVGAGVVRRLEAAIEGSDGMAQQRRAGRAGLPQIGVQAVLAGAGGMASGEEVGELRLALGEQTRREPAGCGGRPRRRGSGG